MTATMDPDAPVSPAETAVPVAGSPGTGKPRRAKKVKQPRTTRQRRTAPPRPAGPPSQAETASMVLSSSFTMIAIVSLWMAVQLLLLGSVSQNRDQDLLYQQLRSDLAGATAPVGPIVPVGDPVALLTIPGIDLEQVVVEGTASGDLLAGPGHRRDTPLPGQVGTSVVYGRGATYGGPFKDVPDLRVGDDISVVDGQGKKTFHVIDVRRAGDPLPQPAADGVARLTLVTAEGSGRLGPISPQSVVYVDAEAKKGYPAPTGRPAAVPESEKAMASDPRALPLMALCLALLLALTLGVVAARQRWSTVLVWVIASPLAIALSWVSTDVLMRLLPNLI